MKILPQKFFNRPTLIVARDLLGSYLIRKTGRKIIRLIITEVEAYDGFKDKASHASRGLTRRNFPMFGKAGIWYVYFTYGRHWLLNIVCGPENYPAAVLIRGVKTKTSITSMFPISAIARNEDDGNNGNINGPARLTKYLKIDKKFNNKLASRKTGLWIAVPKERPLQLGNEARVPLRKNFGAGRFKVKSSSRIGVSYAGPAWSRKLWRFKLVEK